MAFERNQRCGSSAQPAASSMHGQKTDDDVCSFNNVEVHRMEDVRF